MTNAKNQFIDDTQRTISEVLSGTVDRRSIGFLFLQLREYFNDEVKSKDRKKVLDLPKSDPRRTIILLGNAVAHSIVRDKRPDNIYRELDTFTDIVLSLTLGKGDITSIQKVLTNVVIEQDTLASELYECLEMLPSIEVGKEALDKSSYVIMKAIIEILAGVIYRVENENGTFSFEFTAPREKNGAVVIDLLFSGSSNMRSFDSSSLVLGNGGSLRWPNVLIATKK